jgi:hypothetical protein
MAGAFSKPTCALACSRRLLQGAVPFFLGGIPFSIDAPEAYQDLSLGVPPLYRLITRSLQPGNRLSPRAVL